MKINKKQCNQLRTLFASGESIECLAKLFDISKSSVYTIVKNLSHKNEEYQPPARRKPFDTRVGKSLRRKEFSYKKIAEMEAEIHGRGDKPYSTELVRTKLKPLETPKNNRSDWRFL